MHVFAESLSSESSIAFSTVLTFLFSVILGVSIGVLSVLGYQRCRRSGQSSQTETEMETTATVMYEEPGKFKPDPHTQGNLAYGHVQDTGRQQSTVSTQPPTEVRGQLYEELDEFKPDPHTQGNVAYGHVQFSQYR